MTKKPIIVWFRTDLRCTDNAALQNACEQDAPVIPLYVLDDITPGDWTPGAASLWWLHKSLEHLSQTLHRDYRTKLILRRGRSDVVLPKLAGETGATAVNVSRRYEPWAIEEEENLHDLLDCAGVKFQRFAGALLREPESVKTKAGEPFKVYTPFWRAIVSSGLPRKPLPAPAKIPKPPKWPRSDNLADWGLLPTKPDWAAGLRDTWSVGETSAMSRFEQFLEARLNDYAKLRDRPDIEATSRLSPHLHFGEISPATVWHQAVSSGEHSDVSDKSLETFLKELTWREYSSHLLFHFPQLPEQPYRAEFAKFPWRDDGQGLRAWQRGATGYPIVDAGMRELWATGFMHNRVRMVVASFLTKHLLVHWRHGEAWFWDTLVDADLANNAASWQWVAGSGVDAAPYFRIFNPVTQGQKFDPDGAYVRRWIPEIAKLSLNVLHTPWEASELALARAGVRLGETYPAPIVDHRAARERALASYDKIKSGSK